MNAWYAIIRWEFDAMENEYDNISNIEKKRRIICWKWREIVEFSQHCALTLICFGKIAFNSKRALIRVMKHFSLPCNRHGYPQQLSRSVLCTKLILALLSALHLHELSRRILFTSHSSYSLAFAQLHILISSPHKIYIYMKEIECESRKIDSFYEAAARVLCRAVRDIFRVYYSISLTNSFLAHRRITYIANVVCWCDR